MLCSLQPSKRRMAWLREHLPAQSQHGVALDMTAVLTKGLDVSLAFGHVTAVLEATTCTQNLQFAFLLQWRLTCSCDAHSPHRPGAWAACSLQQHQKCLWERLLRTLQAWLENLNRCLRYSQGRLLPQQLRQVQAQHSQACFTSG
jgi:hypothetical protein